MVDFPGLYFFELDPILANHWIQLCFKSLYWRLSFCVC